MKLICQYCKQDTDCMTYAIDYKVDPFPILMHDKINVCTLCDPRFKRDMKENADEVRIVDEIPRKAEIEWIRPNAFGW